MGKNKKKSNKNNAFKVAGKKNLKKSKPKAVNLGLKNLKKKVEDVDAQLVEIQKTPPAKKAPPQKAAPPKKGRKRNASKNKAKTEADTAKATESISKMDVN